MEDTQSNWYDHPSQPANDAAAMPTDILKSVGCAASVRKTQMKLTNQPVAAPTNIQHRKFMRVGVRPFGCNFDEHRTCTEC